MEKLLFFRHNRFSPQEALPETLFPVYGLTFVLDGEMEYDLDGVRLILKAGDGVFLRPGVRRARRAASGVDYCSIHFSTDEAPALPAYLPRAAGLCVRQILSICEEVTGTAENYEDSRFESVLSLLLRQLIAQREADRANPVARQIKQYLAQNVHRTVSLAEVGRAVNFSPNYCQTLFKRETGQSILRFFLDLRIRAARELIAAGEPSLPEIARLTGFDDYNYFARQFKKRTGYTPTQYRRFVW